jgi:hypothetical protein
MTNSTKLSITGITPATTTSEKKKVEKLIPTISVDFENGVMTIKAELEIDFNQYSTLEILEQLKLSESGKGYNIAFAQLKNVNELSGQFSVNIKADKMLALKDYAQQRILKTHK